MKTFPSAHPHTLQTLAANRLARAISLVLAGLFTFDVSSAEAQTSMTAAGAVGVRVDGTVTQLDQETITSGAISAAAAKGQIGVQVRNGGEVQGSGVIVDMAPKTAANVLINATDMTGAQVGENSALTLTGSTIQMGGGASGLNNMALVSIGGIVDFSAGAISTLSKGSIGVLVMDNGQIVLRDTTVTTTGAASTVYASHGLVARTGGSIVADNVQVTTSGSNSSGARAESGSRIDLNNSTLTSTNAATSTATTAVLHALDGSTITGNHLIVQTSGNYVGGARAEGAGSQINLANSDISVLGAGNVLNPSAAARAMAGGALVISNSRLIAQNQYGHGVQVEGAGSSARISQSTINAQGARAMGLTVSGGATASIETSSILLDGTTGPAAPGVQVENAGSTLSMRDTDVKTTQKTSYGVRAIDGAVIDMHSGQVVTEGDYSAGISAAQSQITATAVNVFTSGNDNAMGVLADLGSTITLNGGSVTTTGNGSPIASNLTFAHALASRNAGALLIANGTALHTTGSQSYGAAVDDGGSMILNNLSVKTEGAASRGLYAGIGAAKPGAVSLVGNGISVETLGDNAAGAFVSRKYKDETAELTLNNSTVRTHGALSYALQADSGALLVANNTAANAAGNGAHAALIKNDATFNGETVLLNATGNGAAALATQADYGRESHVNLDGAVLDNRSGATVDVGGAASINFDHVIAGGSGQWLNVGRSGFAVGNANLDLGTSLVTGSATTATGSVANLNLHDTSLWQLTGNSNLTSLRNDNSLINFSAPVGNAFKTLSVNSYHGANGTIGLNTYLFDDNSPSDQLVIDGGRATGLSNLQISNAGGAGALTQGNGIQVVNAINGAATDAGAFRLLSEVKAGPYQYTLHRASLDDSNPEAWYLRSTVGDGNDETPNYRPETSLYSGMPVQALLYSRAMVDTLHERVGEERRRASVDPLVEDDASEIGPSLGWGRLIYRTGTDNRGAADYNYDLQALQVGADLYRSEDTDGSTNQAGLSLGLGKVTGSSHHTDGRYAGDDALRAYSIGGYWTHFGPAGWYLDGVLQLSHFSATAKPDSVEKLHTRGHGITASLEAGYPMLVNADKEIYVEPQAQIIVSKIKLQDTHDSAADVRFDDVNSVTGRLGVRVARDWFNTDDKGDIHRTNGWIRPSVWHEFKGQPKTEFSSAEGYVPFTTDMGGTWGEINVGVDYELNARTSLTGSLGYQKAFNGDSRSYEGMFGIKVKF